jgi:hypothetical protein
MDKESVQVMSEVLSSRPVDVFCAACIRFCNNVLSCLINIVIATIKYLFVGA